MLLICHNYTDFWYHSSIVKLVVLEWVRIYINVHKTHIKYVCRLAVKNEWDPYKIILKFQNLGVWSHQNECVTLLMSVTWQAWCCNSHWRDISTSLRTNLIQNSMMAYYSELYCYCNDCSMSCMHAAKVLNICHFSDKVATSYRMGQGHVMCRLHLHSCSMHACECIWYINMFGL